MSDELTPPPAPVPAGWYPDASNPGHHRWWDGFGWTDATQPVQPAPPPPPPAHVGTPETPTWSPTVPLPPVATEDVMPTAIVPPYAPPSQAYVEAAAPAPSREANPLALWALIVGIAGVLTGIIPVVGLLFGVVALVLGLLGLSRARAVGAGRPFSITGVILGAVAATLGLIITLVVVVGGAAASRAGFSEAVEEPVVTPSASAEPVEPAPQPTAAATPPSAAAPPADGDPDFLQDSRNDLEDFGKDLDDMIVTLDEDGFWRLLSNSLELSFNYGQLASREAPASISADWTAQLAALEGQITRIDEAIADERYDDLRAVIAEAQGQLGVLNGVLDRVGA